MPSYNQDTQPLWLNSSKEASHSSSTSTSIHGKSAPSAQQGRNDSRGRPAQGRASLRFVCALVGVVTLLALTARRLHRARSHHLHTGGIHVVTGRAAGESDNAAQQQHMHLTNFIAAVWPMRHGLDGLRHVLPMAYSLRACAAGAVSLIALCAALLPDSAQRWPHPLLWRLLGGCGVVYVSLIILLMTQPVQTTKRLLTYYDASLANPLPERTYAEDCQLFQSHPPYLRVSQVSDVFIVAHALGYVLKTLIVRDWRMATCLSLAFEVVELLLQHILPNFRECWWDHVLLDVLLCNAAGTLVGMWLLRRSGAMTYDWITCVAPHRRGGGGGAYNVFVSARQLLEVCGMLFFMLLQELNCFTMKAVLHIPVKHHLVSARLLLWFFLALPGMREYYVHLRCPASALVVRRGGRRRRAGSCDMRGGALNLSGIGSNSNNNKRTPRLGFMAWLTTVGLLLETVWIAKMAVEGATFVSLHRRMCDCPGLRLRCVFRSGL